MRNKENYNIWHKHHRKKFPYIYTLQDIKARCTNKNNKRYKNYGGRGIKCLITKEEIKELWIRDCASEMERPSIDRINNDGNYEFSNCRFIEMRENSGRNKRKPILQYDLEGNFIKEWDSITMAGSKLNVDRQSISIVAKNKRKTAGGFIWKYKENV